jgi:hypothetical protein
MMGGAQQCAAQVVSMWPREGATWVPGLGEPAEERVRHDCPAAAAGTHAPASKPFSQANMCACKLYVYK